MRISDWSSDVCSSDLEEGGVGFDEQPVLRQPFGGRLQVGGIPERHDPRDRDIEAEIERPPREIVACGEAMDDAGIGRLPHLLAEQRERVRLRLAGVDDDRQPRRLRRVDMATKTVLLSRSEERRVGNTGVSTCRSRWAPYN